jgi:hypothetical protein
MSTIGPPVGRGGVGQGFSSGGKTTWIGVRDALAGTKCPHPVGLLARADSRLFEVGTIAPQTSILVGSQVRREGLAAVRLRHPVYARGDDPKIRKSLESFSVAIGTELFVRLSELEGCVRR